MNRENKSFFIQIHFIHHLFLTMLLKHRSKLKSLLFYVFEIEELLITTGMDISGHIYSIIYIYIHYIWPLYIKEVTLSLFFL